MKSLTETYTPLIKNLHDLNQEIRRRLSYTHFVMGPATSSSQQFLEEAQQMQKELENISLIISHHLDLLKIKLQEQQTEDT